ncbi:MAG: hypothetical protein ABJM06_12530 [Gilvibacter sp.]
MKLSNSIKALIIATLLTGNLALLLWGSKISYGVETVEESYDIQYDTELLEEALAEAEAENSSTPVKTHRVFNETAKDLSKLDQEAAKDQESFNDRLAAMDAALEDNKKSSFADTPEETSEEEPKDKTPEKQIAQNDTKNSTNSFRLIGRDALFFPNPVYTCQASGKVVVNITVNARGTVSTATVNETSSTTANGCLWDMALAYANRARFSKSSRASQLGTISYVFPGQN